MDLKIDTEVQGNILVITATGTQSFGQVVRLGKQIFDLAAEKQIDHILVNALAVDGTLTTLERYGNAVQLTEYLQQRRMMPKIAIVGKPPSTDGFAVRVAQNRSVPVEVFASVQEALNWLGSMLRTRASGSAPLG